MRSGKVTQQQLDEAVKRQQLTKKSINETLVEIGAITERQMVEILEVQLGLPSVQLYETEIDRSVVLSITEAVARKYCLIPIQRQGGKIKVAIADPLNYEAIEEVRLLTGSMIQPLIAAKSEIEEAIRQHYRLEDSMGGLLEEADFSPESNLDEEQDEQSAPIIRMVHQIIQSAVLQKASDIHIDPQEKQVLVRYRLDGMLQTEKQMPKSMQNVLTARLKIMAKLNIAEKRLPQDGRIHMKIEKATIDIRVSTLPTVFGESIVLRILDQSAGIKKINELHFSESNDRNFERMIQKPYGLLLISGPTGSGKTSTLYSALGQLNRPDVKIVTIEDPVEYNLQGITQVHVNPQIGLTFAVGLRSILRQDPNIVMVGEVRDTETAEIVVRASLTGHLVLSTIHTNNALSAIHRLNDMGIDRYLIAPALSCVVAQRLVRKVCASCAQFLPAREDEFRLFEENGLLDSSEGPLFVTKGKGCGACNHTGYSGRIAIQEVLVVDEQLRRLIIQHRPLEEMEQHLRETGYETLLVDGLRKAQQGLTTVEEVIKAVSDE
ncbi:type II/IV secretion system protein [Paenibacillus sp. S3N08]|uniref:Type II/IV secretion system protein n=2 Tax=Paenibacillus agricola TaxID=2716264 RepID=A0ABX0J0B5_9BACL|nr:type II/IV secretion system protein [Paenibacillus agricola]